MNHLLSNIDKRIITQFNKTQPFTLESSLLLLCEIGSRSHGTHIPASDKDSIDDTDYMGIIVPPENYTLGLMQWEGCVIKHEELDVVFYSLQKFLSMAINGNPNVIGLLWLKPEFYVYGAPGISSELLQLKTKIVAKHFITSFVGYARGQLSKMTSSDPEKIREYVNLQLAFVGAGATPSDIVSASMGQLQNIHNTYGISIADMTIFQELHKKYFSGYMGEKRKAMVLQYGYDVKNASHLIRLLRVGLEFIQTGQINVFRTTDAQELIDIKRGKWSRKDVEVEAERLFTEIASVEKTSKSPEKVNKLAISNACVDLQVGFYLQKGTA